MTMLENCVLNKNVFWWHPSWQCWDRPRFEKNGMKFWKNVSEDIGRFSSSSTLPFHRGFWRGFLPIVYIPSVVRSIRPILWGNFSPKPRLPWFLPFYFERRGRFHEFVRLKFELIEFSGLLPKPAALKKKVDLVLTTLRNWPPTSKNASEWMEKLGKFWYFLKCLPTKYYFNFVFEDFVVICLWA